MKKSLIALAVAGAFAAPAFAATGNVDIYGVMSVAVEDTDIKNSDIQVTDRVSKIGFKGSEDLGGGLKAIWQIESQLNATGEESGTDGLGGKGTIGGRNTFVGLAGDFGTFVMGRHDTPYKLGTASLDVFSDTMGDYNFGCIAGCVNAIHDYRTGNAIAYISPTFSGFHAAAAVVATNGGDALNDTGNSAIDAISLTGVYANGPLFASLSYQNVEDAAAALAANKDVGGFAAAAASVSPAPFNTVAGIVAALGGSDAWKLGLGYTMGDAKVGLIYEAVNVDAAFGDMDINSWTLNGVYNMGPIALKASYADQDFDGADASKWVIGADYSLSKRTMAYIVYSSTESDADALTKAPTPAAVQAAAASLADVSGWAIGLKHSF